ncbi:hypothetical protein V7087_15855 [Neobacillus niacini]|uniref:hypothetical protein n=1 Tax=Neobacillus niacini TaxID=86668 RepID=UPI002FFE4E44
MILTFKDFGIPVPVEEARTSAFCYSSEKDCRFVIAAKGFVVIINPETGRVKQVLFPEGNTEYPYSSYCMNGLFYTGAANMFMVLDPFQEKFIYHKSINNGEEIIGFSFGESMTGTIFFTSYPHCHLLSFYPETKEFIDYGSLDPTEKYPGSVALDQQGWVYIGIGTEKKNLIAFHPEKNILKSLVPSFERQKGAGYVYLGEDGGVYGHWEASDLKDVNNSLLWWKFSGGECQPVDISELSPSCYSGTGFQKIHRNQETIYCVASYSLSEGYVNFKNLQTGRSNQVEVSYQSEGASLSTLVKGSDGQVYGTSMHPLQFYRLDCTKGEITNYGGQVIDKGGGGNIAAYAIQGNVLVGAAYPGGKLYCFDLTKPFERGLNPHIVSEEKEIHRPRCALALSDQKHVVWGGFPGYGMVGGGLGIFDLETCENTLLSHHQIVPYQSTLCLGELRSGDLVGGTSIEAPGGAQTKAQSGVLYIMDWKGKKMTHAFVPIIGAREIAQIFIDSHDLVHGLTDQSIYFVCDPFKQEVLYREELSCYGNIVRNGFVFDETTQTLYCLLSKALLAINLKSEAISGPRVIRSLPMEASSGIVLHQSEIFYGSGSRLCSVAVTSN